MYDEPGVAIFGNYRSDGQLGQFRSVERAAIAGTILANKFWILYNTWGIFNNKEKKMNTAIAITVCICVTLVILSWIGGGGNNVSGY